VLICGICGKKTFSPILADQSRFSKIKSFITNTYLISKFQKKIGLIRAIRGKNPTAFKSKEILKFYPSKS